VKQATGGCSVSGIDNSTGGTVTLTDSSVWNNAADGIHNQGGTLTLLNSTVSDSAGRNVVNFGGGVLTVINSTISNGGGAAEPTNAAGIYNVGQMTMLNSTVSGNVGAGIHNAGGSGAETATLTNCTVSDNTAGAIRTLETAITTLASTVVDGGCNRDVVSDGYNIESPGDTCGFDDGTDLVNITEGQLDLGPLADNGGPTMTHALLPGSVAIDHIPAVDCEATTDQRGEPRPGGTMCDVGSFEVRAED
jgi:hypothetical protein